MSIKYLLLSILSICLIDQVFSKTTNSHIERDSTKIIRLSTVGIAKNKLTEHPYKDVLQEKIEQEILYFPNSFNNSKLVKTGNNALIQTLQHCYDEHRPLILSPDIIWLTIVQGLSIHINENFEDLEPKIFKNKKPDKIVCRNDSLEYGGKHWEKLIEELAFQTQHYTASDHYPKFCPKFSTTQNIETTAYNINLLHTYKKAFKYVGESGCGIPSITIKGKKSDWTKLMENLEILDDFNLQAWKNSLIPIIDQFIAVYSNETNTLFWEDIYKSSSEYNAFYISGWIIKLYPYIVQEKRIKYDTEKDCSVMEKIFTKNNYINKSDYLLSTLSTDNFPSGISSVDIQWNNHFNNEHKEYIIHSGFMGIQQSTNKALKPCIGWSVSEKNSTKVKSDFDIHILDTIVHHNISWTPKVISKLEQPAVYNPRKYKSKSSKSLRYIKSVINKKINTQNTDTVSFILLSDGNITNITYNGNKKYLPIIKNTISQLDSEWLPALADPKKVFNQSNIDDINSTLIKVNSRVVIPLSNQKNKLSTSSNELPLNQREGLLDNSLLKD